MLEISMELSVFVLTISFRISSIHEFVIFFQQTARYFALACGIFYGFKRRSKYHLINGLTKWLWYCCMIILSLGHQTVEVSIFVHYLHGLIWHILSLEAEVKFFKNFSYILPRIIEFFSCMSHVRHGFCMMYRTLLHMQGLSQEMPWLLGGGVHKVRRGSKGRFRPQ